MKWDGMGWDGMEWGGMGWDGMRWDWGEIWSDQSMYYNINLR